MLKHDFIVTEKVASINELYECTRISIDDYIINYIRDTLKWIPSHWNTINDNHCDINYHGITIYTVDSIIRMKDILNSWKNIFVQAPDSFELKGEFMWDSDASIMTGRYEWILIKKAILF